MNKLGIMIVALLMSFNLQAKTESWIIDKAHTKVGFEISHLIISSVEGRFTDFSGKLSFDLTNTKNTGDFKLDANVVTSSIDTGNAKRDKHLKSPDFFNATKHKSLKFVSTSFTTSDGKSYKVTGKLTISGITKDVVFDTKFLGSAEAYDVKRVAFVGKTTIKREDFGLTWNDGEVKASTIAGKLAEATGAIGSDVTIELKVQAKRAADL